MKKGILFFLVVLLIFSGCEQIFDFGEFFEIRGQVFTRIGDNDHPVEGALVRSGNRTASTNSQGYFALKVYDTAPGTTVGLEISKEGYETYQKAVFLSGSSILNLGFIELKPFYPHMAIASGEIRVGAVKETSSFSSLETRSLEEKYVPGQVLVSRQEKSGDFKVLDTLERSNLEIVEVPAGMTVEEAVGYFQTQPGIIFAEPNYFVYSQSLPNDPGFKDQWNLKTINYPGAWFEIWGNNWNDIRVAAQDIWIGVLDTGVNQHEDLDFGGNILFHRGINLFDPDRGEEPYDYTDSTGKSHGTHIIGTIAAKTNNNLGITGAAPGVRIVPYRVLGKNGIGTVAILVEGIEAAIDEGVDILNMSLGTTAYSSILHEAIIDAYNEGTLIVAAAGNSPDSGIFYPAAFPEVIAVGAIDRDRSRADFSSVGPQLELMAPGVSVLGPFYNNVYGTMSGTSMAVPHVSALAALIWAEEPSLSLEGVRFRMRSTAGNFFFPNDYVGYGTIDVFRALAPDMPPVKVFAGVESGNQIILKSEIKEVIGGEYKLYRVEPGNRRIYAWIDANGSGKIDEGDYFARSSVYYFGEGQERNIEILNLLYQWGSYTGSLEFESLEIVVEE